MNKHTVKFTVGFFLVAGLLAAGGIGHAGEVVVSNFDNADDAALWSWESWSDPAEVAFDETLNAGGGAAGSGSLRVANLFTKGANEYSQAVVTIATGGDIDAETLYTKISLDIKVDPSSAPRANSSDYGGFEVIFRNGSDWVWHSLGNVALTNTSEWAHLEFPVAAPGDKVHHLTLKLGGNGLTNTIIYNIDNIRWTEASNQVPPPTLAIEEASKGLNLTAGTTGQYDRQNIKSVPLGLGWVGVSEPVAYSITLNSFPATNYAGFQTHMYLVPGTPGTESSPDWNEPAAIIIGIQGTAEGGGTVAFRYKTDAPGSNGGYFNTDPAAGQVGFLGSLTASNILGTWTVTFSQDNQIALTAPDGTSTNLVMPIEDAQKFAGDITFYCGIMPNQAANIGQTAILSAARITSGTTVLLNDNFSTNVLNSELWTVNASSASCVAVVGQKDLFWISWTTPASGFVLQTNTDANPTTWVTPDPVIPDALLGNRKRALITESVMSDPKSGFFRLIKSQ
ncbi:MAG TPA: hypothetical protein P5186_02105 [Candidatus Paceibacterota bacterium]|nr:hypothetical protein [Candidatus Paceibacterota bacterium]